MEVLGVLRKQRSFSVVLCLLGISSYVIHHAEAADEAGEVPKSLQEYLDGRCVELYASLCSQGNKDFCNPELKPVARKGLGIMSQNKPTFRCYDKSAVEGDSVDTSSTGVQCVDNCGQTVPCKGTVKRNVGAFHATYEASILKWIEERKSLYCSPLQKKLNDFCERRSSGSLGRVENGNVDARLLCVTPDTLVFEGYGFCLNECGFPSVCPGRPVADSGVGFVSLTEADKNTLMHQSQRPCALDERCVQPPGKPVECLEVPASPVDLEDNLQTFMDKQCTEGVRETCRSTKSLSICSAAADIVYRVGYGHEGQKQAVGRCYNKTKIERPQLINNDAYGVKCVENCGKLVPCGGTVNIKSIEHITHPGISDWLRRGILMYCSAPQQALQLVCDKLLPGSVARLGVVSGSDSEGRLNDAWRCLRTPAVSYEGIGMCLNNCGGLSQCHGGRQTTGNLGTDVQLVIPENDVKTALATVEGTCSLQEICYPTSANPPTCEMAPYEPEETIEHARASTFIEDGEVLSMEFVSQHVTVRIGPCLEATVNIEEGKFSVRGLSGATHLSLGPSEPPYKIEVARIGRQVHLTLHYNSNAAADGGGSLVYVQPSVECVDRDRVVVEGVETEAQFSRSTLKNISPVTE